MQLQRQFIDTQKTQKNRPDTKKKHEYANCLKVTERRVNSPQ